MTNAQRLALVRVKQTGYPLPLVSGSGSARGPAVRVANWLMDHGFIVPSRIPGAWTVTSKGDRELEE